MRPQKTVGMELSQCWAQGVPVCPFGGESIGRGQVAEVEGRPGPSAMGRTADGHPAWITWCLEWQ